MGESIVTLLDPFFLVVAFIGVSLGHSKHYIVPLTGVFIGVLAETMAMKVTLGYVWGEGFMVFLAAGMIQSIVAYFLVDLWRKHRSRSRNSAPEISC